MLSKDYLLVFELRVMTEVDRLSEKRDFCKFRVISHLISTPVFWDFAFSDSLLTSNPSWNLAPLQSHKKIIWFFINSWEWNCNTFKSLRIVSPIVSCFDTIIPKWSWFLLFLVCSLCNKTKPLTLKLNRHLLFSSAYCSCSESDFPLRSISCACITS